MTTQRAYVARIAINDEGTYAYPFIKEKHVPTKVTGQKIGKDFGGELVEVVRIEEFLISEGSMELIPC